MNQYVLDIETTIPATKFRIGGIRRVNDPESCTFHFTNLSELLACITRYKMGEGDTIYTWNGSRFDIPKIGELLMEGESFLDYLTERGIEHVDGMLLSKMVQPNDHSHGLANQAKKWFPLDIDMHKDPVPKDWEGRVAFYNETPLPELSQYLEQDLITTEHVVRKVLGVQPDSVWKHGLKVEQGVAEIVQRQVDTGVAFDFSKGNSLYLSLAAKKEKLERELESHLPIVAIPETQLHYPPKIQFKKDGTPNVRIKNYCDKYGHSLHKLSTGGYIAEKKDGGATVMHSLPIKDPLVTTEKLTPKDTSKLKNYLLSRGWKPSQWNTKKDKVTGKSVRTSPLLSDRVTKEPCPALSKVDLEWVPKVAQWLQVRAKMSILLGSTGKSGWLKDCKSGEGGYALPSEADTCGTPTARFRHRGIVNVPRVGSFMGKEMRSLFTARKGKVMVGWDADSLEAKMEAHYVYPFDNEYAEALCSGDSAKGTDIHTLNWKRLGLPNRDVAKTFKYAITYGAKPKKLASSLNVSVEQASEWYDRFWEENKGLRALVKNLGREWNSFDNKHLIGLDGRWLTTRYEHALLNTKLQGGGAILMKHAMIIADHKITKLYGREKAHGLIRMHDEEQWECDEDIASVIGELGCNSVKEAGEYLQCNVPFSASYKVGSNWAETH